VREKNFRPAGGGSVLRRTAGRGSLEGWAPCGGRKGERQRERGGAWARSGAEWRCGIGAAASRPRRARATCCHVIVEDGVADRGLGRDGGPVISGWVRREAAW
jgi:hypothetical protein